MSRIDQVDLEGLARPERSERIPAPRRRWRYGLIPVVLILALGALLWPSVQEMIEPALRADIIRPVPAEGQALSSRQVLFTAAGWVEPDPFPHRVPSLADGVVEEVLVQEADRVRRGDVMARLIDDDARLALRRARAEAARAEAELRRASAEHRAAREAFDAALEVTERRDRTAALVSGREAELKRLREAVKEARAEVEVARAELETQRYLREHGAAGPWQVERAEAELASAHAALLRFEAESVHIEATLEEARVSARTAARDFELRIEDRRRVEVAAAGERRAEADLQVAKARFEEAELTLERMEVKSPADGVVLRREAMPGSTVGPAPGRSAVVSLYDPRSLRVRVDVPQGQVGAAQPGLSAEIRCDARRGEPYAGEVLRVVERADLQKVTLEVQVKVLDPDSRLKPEMLCQVAVQAPERTDRDGEQREAVRVPERAIVEQNSVWVVVPGTGRAVKRTVELGGVVGSDRVVLAGLNLSDKVLDPSTPGLESGVRIEPRE